MRTFKGHDKRVSGLQIVGHMLYTSAYDTTIIEWKITVRWLAALLCVRVADCGAGLDQQDDSEVRRA